MQESVAVIGGGWHGIYALKYMAAEKATFKPTMFENTDTLGGVWVYGEKRKGGVCRSTVTTASKIYLQASDFPLPDDFPYFPPHWKVLKYLHDYCRHFDLNKYVQLNTWVRNVVPDAKAGKGYLITADGHDKPIHFDRVIVAAGVADPITPQHREPWRSFTGVQMTSADYKFAGPEMEGKSVLIVGGGESASDIAVDVCKVAGQTYMSLRSGAWMHDRLWGGYPADELVNRAVFTPGLYDSALINAAKFVLERFWGEGGSGVPEWKPKGPYFRSFLNKSRDVLQEVSRGRVLARSEITGILADGRTLLSEGHADYMDIIIYATGLAAVLDFLDESIRIHPADCYENVFHPRHADSLAFVGYTRPVFGSFFSMAELQSRWIAATWAGRCKLPSVDEMEKYVVTWRKWHAETFPIDDKSGGGRSCITSQWDYADRIAWHIGAKPKLWKEYFTSPRTWWLLMTCQWNPWQYLINDPKTRAYGLHMIRKEWPPVGHYGFYVCYVFAVVHIGLAHAAVVAGAAAIAKYGFKLF